jgi:hypothetical protein
MAEGPGVSAGDQWDSQIGTRGAGPSCLDLGCGVLAVLAIAVVGGMFMLVQLTSVATPHLEAVPAQVRQSTAVALLSDTAPIATGHIRLRSGQIPEYFTVVLSSGVPELATTAATDGASFSLSSLVRDPLVRMSVSAPAGGADSQPCVASCEISLPLDQCANGCNLDIPFRLELVPQGSDSQVRISLTAAASVPPSSSLPGGLELAITLDQTPGAGGSTR